MVQNREYFFMRRGKKVLIFGSPYIILYVSVKKSAQRPKKCNKNLSLKNSENYENISHVFIYIIQTQKSSKYIKSQ